MIAVLLLVCLTALAMLTGAFAATYIRIHPSFRLVVAIGILLAGFALLGKDVWQTISWVAFFPFLGGFWLQRKLVICPCGSTHRSCVKAGLVAGLVCLMFGHSLLDGHLLAEFTNQPSAAGTMVVHKFFDGLALAVLLGERSRVSWWLAVVCVATATPLGLVYLPREILSSSQDAWLDSVL